MKLAIIAAALLLTGCASYSLNADIPDCSRYIPPSMAKPVDPTDIPEPRQHSDGHQDALPWQEGFLGQTGQLEKANDRGDGIGHIYKTCLDLHREALRKSNRGFFGRLFNR